MTATQNSTEILLNKIQNKRAEIDSFLACKEPRNRRLTNIAIICGAIAAVLTAGPALGGNTFTALISDAFGLSSPAWQLLCLAATIFSMTATIAINMSKSSDIRSQIDSARGCEAKLEGLQTLLELKQIEMQQAAALYTSYLTEIPHVPAASRHKTSSPDAA